MFSLRKSFLFLLCLWWALGLGANPNITSNIDIINLMVKTDPVDPHNERFLGEWRLELFSIDDDGLKNSMTYFGRTGWDGLAHIEAPVSLLARPMIVRGTNPAFPLEDHDNDGAYTAKEFEIFVPGGCFDKALWLLGPLEDALWEYYQKPTGNRGESWNPSQAHCQTWLNNLQLLILTDEVDDALEDISESQNKFFSQESLYEALQENQHLLVPTRPPICLAERRHNDGDLDRAHELISMTVGESEILEIGENGLVKNLCGQNFNTELVVNTVRFSSEEKFLLDSDDFHGTIADQEDITLDIDASVYTILHSNGRELDHEMYREACAVTTMMEFTNKDDDEQDILTTTGIYLERMLGEYQEIVLTSDGDKVVDKKDTWILLGDGAERIVALELLGHREEDFRDVLKIDYDRDTGEVFLGLRADHELNEEEVDGERAYFGFTMSVWNNSSIHENMSNCYEASDVWARQYISPNEFSTMSAAQAAEMAVRSQCFSNSRSQQRWQSDDVGFWNMGTHYGIHPNIVINSGWLAPDLDFEIYVQKFDEAVFKGPRIIARTDESGQIMAALPTIVEGDRVLLKSEDNCCDDYDLVLPCVPEFTGFAGAPGVPYIPTQLGPILEPIDGSPYVPIK